MLALTIGIFVLTAAAAGIYMFLVTGIFGVDTSIQIELFSQDNSKDRSQGHERNQNQGFPIGGCF